MRVICSCICLLLSFCGCSLAEVFAWSKDVYEIKEKKAYVWVTYEPCVGNECGYTGVGGTNDSKGGWHEYQSVRKEGDTNRGQEKVGVDRSG